MRALQLVKRSEIVFLLITSSLFSLLRLPSLFEPYWYGDEGIYQVIGLALRNHRMLYKDIWDNKPPLLYVVYSLLGSDQFLVRMASLFCGLISIVVFYFLARKLLQHAHRFFVYFATLLYTILFGTPLIEGNIANAENFMLLPILIAALCCVYYIKTLKDYFLIIAGFCLSLAFLFKVVALFDFSAFLVFLFFMTYTKGSVLKQVKTLLPYVESFLFPIVVTGTYFALNQSFEYFLKASFLQNISYVGYGNQFIISQGFLFVKIFVLSLLLLGLFLKRRQIPLYILFIVIWTMFSVFNTFFAQRPYIHYVLVLLPSYSLLCGLVLSRISLRKKTMEKYTKELFISFIVISLSILLGFKLYYKTLSYYLNFISFVTYQKDVHAYQSFFDANTPNDYEIATYIKNHTEPSDTIFLWGNNAQVYALTNKLPPGRFTVAYHITAQKNNMNETRDAIERKRPKYIIVTSSLDQIPYSLINYKNVIHIKNATIYEQIY